MEQKVDVKEIEVNMGPMVNDVHLQILNAPYTDEEVKGASFDIHGDKSPGPNGFESHFFRDS